MFSRIVPAIMPESFVDIRRKVASVIGTVPMVQLDIMDGVFVENDTWPFRERYDDYWVHLQAGQIPMPLSEGIEYELDLMIDAPEDTLDRWLMLEPQSIIAHIESIYDIEKLIDYYDRLDGIVECGISLNNTTEIRHLDAIINHVDFIQVMGIKEIGYQGTEFDAAVFDTISSIQGRYPGVNISIDGGVSRKTIAELARIGVGRFVSGSSVFKKGDARMNIRHLVENL
jgi:ribulose-phosphate 3-epimerase